MAKQKFTHFIPRDKPKKHRGIHTKSLNKHKKLQKKLTRYKGQGRQMKILLSKRNPVAKTLKTSTQKIVPDKKKYDRKKIKKPFQISDRDS